MQLLLNRRSFSSPEPVHLALILLIFATFMGIGALVSWVWLPDIQNPREPRERRESPPALESGTGVNNIVERNAMRQREGGAAIVDGMDDGAEGSRQDSWLSSYKVPNKSLEELAEGWAATVDRGQVLSFRRKLGIYDALQPVVAKIQGWLLRKGTRKEE